MQFRDGDAHQDAGHEAIDREHQVQLGLMDTLHRAVRAKQDDAETGELLDRLLEYSRVHFLSEQILMRLHAYPDYEAHVIEHDRMIGAMEELRAGWQESRLDAPLEVIEALRHDLSGHIRRHDHELGKHLAGSGIGVPRG
jgi:hemerythrin